MGTKTRTNRPTSTEAIIVVAGEKTYADLLRKVRNEINIDQLGVNIKELRKTRAGDLLLTVEKGKGEAGQLKRAIDNKLRQHGIVTRDGGRSLVTLQVRGLDGITTAEEAEKALQDASEDKGKQLKVRSIRPGFAGSQNATVVAPPSVAEKLLDLGRVRIGWVFCPVQERVRVKKCLKCWDTGHLTSRCTGISRENLCLKCGKEGHKVKDCRNTPYCPICNQEGHRADSLVCPKYREAMERTKKASARAKAARVAAEDAAAGKGEETGKKPAPEQMEVPRGEDEENEEQGQVEELESLTEAALEIYQKC